MALALATGLRSLARLLAEWAGMHKRVQIVVRNPGYEGTESAMGELSIDFRSKDSYVKAMARFTELLNDTNSGRTIILINEDAEELGFNPEFYHSHRATNVDTWRETWLLPAEGASAPPREEEA